MSIVPSRLRLGILRIISEQVGEQIRHELDRLDVDLKRQMARPGDQPMRARSYARDQRRRAIYQRCVRELTTQNMPVPSDLQQLVEDASKQAAS